SAAMASGMVLLASFFLTTLARLDKGLQPVARFSPLAYYQGGDAIDGLNGRWLLGLFLASACFAALAWWRFERRDIRVVGEGTWRGRGRDEADARAARAALAAGRLDDARRSLEAWIARRPGAAEPQLLLAKLEMARDRPGPALAAIERARALGHPAGPLEVL